MGKYTNNSDWEKLEEDAYRDSIKPKKKPKKQKKEWDENEYKPKQKFDYRKKDKKSNYSNHPDRI